MTNQEGGGGNPATGGKTLTFGSDAWREKLLVSLEDLTPLRGRERLQEIYIVTLGYNVNSLKPSSSLPKNDTILDLLLTKRHWVNKYFFARITPVFSIRRGRKHQFTNGLPLFYEVPGKQVSFYFAVMESDRPQRDWRELLAEKKPDFADIIKALDPLEADIHNGKVSGLISAYKLLITGLQEYLRRCKDDLRYANVFTFRKSEGYLGGIHDNWGNQRVAFTLSVEPPETWWDSSGVGPAAAPAQPSSQHVGTHPA